MKSLTPEEIDRVFITLGLANEETRSKFRAQYQPKPTASVPDCFIKIDNSAIPSLEEQHHA